MFKLLFLIVPVMVCDENVLTTDVGKEKLTVNTFVAIDPDKPVDVVVNDVGTVAGRATARLLFVIVPFSPDVDVNDLTTVDGRE